LLKSSDLPAGWSLIDQNDYTAEQVRTQSSCLTDYPGYVAGASVDFGLSVDPNGRGAVGQLGMDVRITNSASDADKQYVRLQSMDSLTPAARQCELELYRSMVAQAVGLDNLLPGSQLLPRAAPSGPLKGMIFKASVPYKLNGADKVMYLDEIRIQKGRIVARLLFMTCCKAFDYGAVEDPAVQVTTKRIAAG
jgi:hypothetical protein